MNYTKSTFSFTKRSSETISDRTRNLLQKIEKDLFHFKNALFYFNIIANLITLFTKINPKLLVFEMKRKELKKYNSIKGYFLPAFWSKDNSNSLCILFKENNDCIFHYENTGKYLFLENNSIPSITEFIRIQNLLCKLNKEERKIKTGKRILPRICCNCFHEIVDEKYDNVDFFFFYHSSGCF